MPDDSILQQAETDQAVAFIVDVITVTEAVRALLVRYEVNTITELISVCTDDERSLVRRLVRLSRG